MAHSNPNSPISSESELTVEKLKQGFLYIKESTASSPEGLHHAQMIMFAFKLAEPPKTRPHVHQVIIRKTSQGIQSRSSKLEGSNYLVQP
jgi:hypothetical protein